MWLIFTIALFLASPVAATEIRQDSDGTKAGTIRIPPCAGTGKALTHDPAGNPPFGCNTISAVGGDSIPAGALFAFLGVSCPVGYVEETALAGKFPLGTLAANLDVGTTGGQDTITQVITHTHPVNVTDPGHTHLTQRYPTTTGGSSGFTNDTSMSGTLADNTLPTKTATTGVTAASTAPAGAVASIDNRPAFARVLWCKKA